MILVNKVEVFEFRGIRHLEIDFKKKNFAICGKNGTGKSGIVDALEFGLTGDISRLAGSGTGGISLKEHAPHVDSRSNPAKAKVKISAYIPSLNKDVLIERNVSDINNPLIKPATPEILAVIKEVANHPEFTLSRRELIKYVISTPGDRAKEVQALLRLEKVENLRSTLQKIANADKKDIAPIKRQRDDARAQLITALNITEFTYERVLEAVNERRIILGLSALTELNAKTSLRDGLATSVSGKSSNLAKSAAINSINKIKNTIVAYKNLRSENDLKEITSSIEALKDDDEVLKSLNKEGFLREALTFIDSDCCPLCDTEIGIDELAQILKTKLKKFEGITVKRASIVTKLERYIQELRQLHTDIREVKDLGALLNPVVETLKFDEYLAKIEETGKKIKIFLPIEELLECLETYGIVPGEVENLISDLEKRVKAIPDPSKQDGAREYLIIAQEKLEMYRTASASLKKAEDKSALSSKVFDTYGIVVTQTLEDLYRDVESHFIDLYRFINSDDESAFTAQLTPSIGKLGFNVDFYGRGYFPPGAYHSEGHQDGMGLCLYLALMKHILGDNFKFAVLDDVLMSVDTGHRREVCRLLREKFPDTQFILTTHDEVWLKHMRTAGLIQSNGQLQFRKWDVDHGPNEWNEKDVWGEIDDYLVKNDVRSAASLLRHYLEYISADVCHKLRARVEFRGDAQFMLGDLLPSATSQFTKLLDEGIKAANSWGKSDLAEKITLQKNGFRALITNSQVEQWQTNAAIHYNEWANFERKDFEPVAASFKSLVAGFCCTDESCNSLLYLIPDRGERNTLRCACGNFSINLKKK
ncbi:AAA family ATPase [Sphingobacterium sp. DR205]|uniref:AAA family ATPase n=1 Tax=Sphingobacterium sp. DR205 TaxID=2713573 RepID=UPI0013E4A80E|nr:AAA family ATPase [Sphingobacterium sp. DR205]QIH33442.1 AAA family ATPase [Sphingobacterium sp. DR205]